MANNNRNRYNQDWDQNRGRFDQENDFNQNYDSNQNRNMGSYRSSGDFTGTSYGNRYNREDDWNQDQNYNQGMGNSGTNYSQAGYRNDYDSRYDTGNYRDQNYRSQRGSNQGGSYYGGDTRNYGNANQGGMNRDWWDRTKDEVSSWFGDDDAERRRAADRRVSGEHRGKGPKGYTRSDDRIREDVHDRLADDPYVDASDIEVKVENGDVVLTGDVYDREQKRRAEDIIESISGVRNVENRIHVQHEHSKYADANRRRGNYTGTTNDVGNIGNETGTTNEIIRNTGNMNANK